MRFFDKALGWPFTAILLTVIVLMPVMTVPDEAGAQRRSTGALRELQEAFRAVSRTVKPAVVNVSSVRVVEAGGFHPGADPFFENDPFFSMFIPPEILRRLYEQRARPRKYRQQGLGSGFIFDPRGYILTNRHVINGAHEIHVTLQGDKKYQAELIAADSQTDVAIIKIKGSGFPYVELGDSDALEVGDWVLAIGNPFGLMKTVTAGIVSAKGRHDMGILEHEEFIQTDAAINKGNSGGPLVNIDGKVVGMNTFIVSPNGGGHVGIGFAIPSNIVRKVLAAAQAGKFKPRRQRVPEGARRTPRPPAQPPPSPFRNDRFQPPWNRPGTDI